MRNTKKAFTLVELIVVITILAILGTIGFISLQGFSGEARDSKRLSEVNELLKKMTIENAKGTAYSDLITVTNTGTKNYGGTTSTGQVIASQGIVNFANLKESQTAFQDKISGDVYDYPVAMADTNNGTLIQLATINETEGEVRVVGNYFQIDTTNYAAGLIGGNESGGLVNGDPYNGTPNSVYMYGN